MTTPHAHQDKLLRPCEPAPEHRSCVNESQCHSVPLLDHTSVVVHISSALSGKRHAVYAPGSDVQPFMRWRLHT